MMKKLPVYGMAALLSFTLFACSKSDSGSNNNSNNNNGGSTGGGTGGTTAGPLFTAVKGMMQGSCATVGCHSGASPTGGLNFTVDNTIVAQKDRIKVRAVDQAGTANQMPQPPNAALSATDRKKITDWIAAGGRLTD